MHYEAWLSRPVMQAGIFCLNVAKKDPSLTA